MNRIEDVTNYITECDEEVGKALQLELGRQRRNLELIASENIVSPAVMLAMGTVPTNKYAEGYPGKRYYGGYSCISGADQTRRYSYGTEPGTRRTSYTWFTGKPFWYPLQFRTLQCQ